MKKFNFVPVTDETVKQIKLNCKNMGFSVGVKKHKEKYALGGISVYATAKQEYKFTKEQVSYIYDMLQEMGIYSTNQPIDDYSEELQYKIFRDGFNYWGQLA